LGIAYFAAEETGGVSILSLVILVTFARRILLFYAQNPFYKP